MKDLIMNTAKVTLFGIASVAFVSTPLFGQGAWSISARVSVVAAVGGDVHRGPSFDGSVLLDLEPGSLPVEVDAKSFDDVYGSFSEFALVASYQTSESLSYFFGLSSLSSSSGTRTGSLVGRPDRGPT